ncbi:hypothetical protein ACWGLE_08050 [Streptomyces sp. NPDC055897]
MVNGEKYQEELDYLVEYARKSPVYFTIVWDAAESIVGDEAVEEQVRKTALKLIGDMIDRGVKLGDMSHHEGESVIIWELSRAEAVQRVAERMEKYSDPLDYVYICWFVAN